METSKRLSDIDPRDLAVVERVFGQRFETTPDVVLVLKSVDVHASKSRNGGVPDWCNVLEGMSDDELADFGAILEEPVRLTRSTSSDGT